MNFENVSQEETGISRIRSRDIERLEKEHPEVLTTIEELKNPQLPKNEFFALIKSFNEANSSDAPERKGTYRQVSWSVDGLPSRTIKATWFENGRVEISGSDYGE